MVSWHFFMYMCGKSLVNNKLLHTCCYLSYSYQKLFDLKLVPTIWRTFIHNYWCCSCFLFTIFSVHSILINVIVSDANSHVHLRFIKLQVYLFCITTCLLEMTFSCTNLPKSIVYMPNSYFLKSDISKPWNTAIFIWSVTRII